MSTLIFLTCHLTGTGHLVRTLALARTAVAHGHDVTVITGGRPLPHLDTHGVTLLQLPPVSVHGFEFTKLRDPSGALVSDAYMLSRQRMLKQALTDLRPDALITELYPFGRRVLAAEFQHAIKDARMENPAVLVLSSVRDIPEPKVKRLTETATRLLKLYDGVLVHGDGDVLPLDTTWPLPDDLRGMIHHTGYVSAPMPVPGPRGDMVLVAVGGGVLGRALLDVAAQAAALSSRPWHILVGGADAPERAAEIVSRHGRANLTVEAARSDYRTLLVDAGCSVSLAGYNTTVELASCTTPAILVPSEAANEQEQLIRARCLAGHPGITLLREQDMTPALLAEQADRAASCPPRPMITLKRDDGSEAVERIESLLAARKS